MKNLFKHLLLLFLLASVSLHGQITQIKRLEFNSDDGYVDADIYPMGQSGLLQIAKLKKDRGGTVVEFNFFDNNLNLLKSKTTPLPKKFSEYFSDYTPHNYAGIWSKYNGRGIDYMVFYSNFDNKSVDYFRGKLKKKEYFDDIILFDRYIVMTIRKKKDWKIFVYDKSSNSERYLTMNDLLPGVNPLTIKEIKTQRFDNQGRMMFFIRTFDQKTKRNDLWVVAVNRQMEATGHFKINNPGNLELRDVSATLTDGDVLLLTGTYTPRPGQDPQGVFFAKADKGKTAFLKTYHFSDFKNFFNFLPKRKQEKMKKKKKRKEARGKKLQIRYHIASHDIITLNGQYIFIGEAYYSTYYTYTTTTYMNGMPQTTTHTVFDGYQYTHAVMAGLDADGNLLWDNIMPMHVYVKPFTVRKYIRVSKQSNGKIKLIASTGPEMYAEILSTDGTIAQKGITSRIETGIKGDDAKRNYSDILYWYDNYYVSFGEQKIKNKRSKDVKTRRYVYFITKVKYEEED